jgi:hypothetical protein
MPFGLSLSDSLRAVHGLAPVQKKPLKVVVARPAPAGPAPQISLKGILERFIASQPDNASFSCEVEWGGERDRGVFHPSEVCKDTACPRALAYELYKAPKVDRNYPVRIRRIFQNGHFVHARYQHLLRLAIEAEGGTFENEVKIAPGSDLVSGSCDGVATLVHPYAVEIKSMNKKNFLELGAQPWPEHRAQLSLYMRKLRIPQGIVIVENKDSQDLREYFIRYDEKVVAPMYTLMNTVLACVAKRDLPPPITVSDGCTGDECSFHPICKGAQKDWRP